MLKKFPESNGLIIWKTIYYRTQADVFAMVLREDGDLSGGKICRVDEKSVPEIANEMRKKVKAVRHEGDPEFRSTVGILRYLPVWLISILLRFISFFTFNLGLDLSFLGIPSDPFAGAMLTSVGRFEIDMGIAYPPLVPYTRSPIIVVFGGARDKVVAEGGQAVVRPMLPLQVTYDHRFFDGVHAARMAHFMRHSLENPEEELYSPQSG